MTRPLRVLLAGAGQWGSVHARKLAARDDVDLAAIWDRNEEKGRALAADLGAAYSPDGLGLPDGLDAAVVAVSTEAHADVALHLMRLGLPVLVEKPLAGERHRVELLLEAGRERPALLHPAWIERHNPAWKVAREVVDRPLFIQTERLTPFSARSLDTDVVLDLMIHDLDLVLQAVGGAAGDADVTEVRAVGGPVLTGQPDMAHVRLEFDGGCVAVLAASRVSLKAVRTVRVFGPAAYLSVDLMERRVHRAWRHADADGHYHLSAEPLQVDADDALEAQHDAFIEAVRSGADATAALLHAGRVMDLAFSIRQDLFQNLGRWLDP
jgi:predicted dehydrogenase